MDCNNKDYEMWEWQSEDYYNLQQDPSLDMSKSLWSGVSANEEEFSYIFDEATPIKACGELEYHDTCREYSNKESEKCRETASQTKRRRMLQFDNEALGFPLCDEDLSSTFLSSKEMEDSAEETLSDVSQWVSGFAEDRFAPDYKGHDQSSEGWLADCINDPELQFSSDDANLSGGSDVQVDITDTPESDMGAVRECRVQTRRNVVFKGRKSYMSSPPKLASSVVYPFAFIKPCGVHGDVTLKDINQRIHTPSQSKSKQRPIVYPTSAFSGKPVVGKTKIHTEGGKGSITIMRTKG